MQKRDKFGRFLKSKVNKSVKHCRAKKVNKELCDTWDDAERCTLPARSKNRTVVKLEKTRIKGKNLNISLFDLQDMIQAEVTFQLKDRW
jgi:hypothetical protein